LKRISAWWFVAAYALALCGLAALRPLWLDELLQLTDTWQHSLAETVSRVAHNPGGVPLAYVAENLLVNASGQPLYMAHAFSIVCAAGGLASLIWLVRLLGVAGGWWRAALLYALLPISLRYAVEARQYGPALAFSIAATAVLVWLDERPGWGKASLYAMVLALGLYTQPYVVFVAAAHFVWFWRRDCLRYAAAGSAAAGSLFLPWYLHARGFWMQAVVDAGYESSINWKTPLQMTRELSGGGYLLTAILLVLAWHGCLRTDMPRSSKRLLLLWAFVPVPAVLGADSAFHYFFAIRQLLFVVPPLCILAGEGLEALESGWGTRVAVAVTVLALLYDVRWFGRAKENWRPAAADARTLVTPGTCVEATPRAAEDLYRLYEPSLPFCSEAEGAKASVVLVSPYASKKERLAVPNAERFGPPVEMGGSEVRKAVTR
jgi:mannosyltransferase